MRSTVLLCGLMLSLFMETTMAEEAGPVVIIGASYAEGWQPGEIAGLPVINRGVGGQQSHEVRARFSRDVLESRPRPEAVLIWGFINDIHRNDRRGMDETLTRAKANIRAMVEQARAQGVTPVLVTEVTVRGPKTLSQELKRFVGDLVGKDSYQDYVNSQVLAVNRWMRDYAAAEGITLLDFETVLADSSGMRQRRFATDDGSHISEAGYRRLSAYTRQRLEPDFFAEHKKARAVQEQARAEGG